MKLFVKDPDFYKKAAQIAIPISLQSMITIGVNLADNVMVGKLGETTLSATSLANQFVGIFQICCMGLGMGASVLTARFWGMKDIPSLKKALSLMIRLCAFLAIVVFTIPTLLFPASIMRLYTNEAPVVAEGLRYFKWIFPCYILQGLALTCTIVLRSVGQVKIPLFSSIGAFFVNVFFNYILIFGKLGLPAMGIEGAALGTLIARIFEFIFICGYLLFIDKKISYRVSDIFIKCGDLLKTYISISMPVFVSDTLLALGNSAVAMVMGRIGQNFVSANAITVVTQQLSTVLIQGICHASCIVTGHTLGEGYKEKAQDEAWTFLGLSMVIGLVGSVIILIISTPIINFYNITDETKAIAHELMNSIALIVVFQSMNSILTKGVLRGGGDTKFLMAADILFLWVLSIPLGALAGLIWHLDAFWIYFFLKIDQIVKSVWCIFRLRSGKWIKVIK
ncbi:MAG: MATE family efflux transporter [Lachnospiraceae bacterium]|nr:MATE family efflux transporter [Lachnospiraceae bacterium]MBO7599583.1 MATE family efflux transporter [Lachnospiraceae bacterium]